MLDLSEPEFAEATCPSPDLSRPALSPGVDLLGEVLGTDPEDRQWLATRDGEFVYMGELAYRICEKCNGRRSTDQIAAAVARSTGLHVEPAQVALIVQDELMPAGLVCPGPPRPRLLTGLARLPLAWSRLRGKRFLEALTAHFRHPAPRQASPIRRH